MDLAESCIAHLTQRLARSLGAGPIGSCATASVALWTLWNQAMRERLTLCIAFDGPAAHHVYLRRGNLVVDPSGHQFDTHKAHCYTIAQEADKHVHHRNTMETQCSNEFLVMLAQVGWPSHQWPTPTKVRDLVQAMQAQGLAPSMLEHVEG